MYRILGASKDSYITNKIINNSYRAVDANVGYAGTLDLFKLFDESTISGSDQPIELSRLLVKFNLDPIRALTGSIVDISDSSFNAKIVLRDVVGGQPTPSNFTVIVHPVSKSWDEGVGRDIGKFLDIDVTNWVTASVSSGFVPWSIAGASSEGSLGSTDIDIIGSGNLSDGDGFRSLYKTQVFESGKEDLEIDVTDIVSATLAGQIPDQGYRIAFSGSFEISSSSLFVKRFATRHSSNPGLRPQLVVKFDDSIADNHTNFVFDTTGSLFMFNSVRGTPKNLVSGAAATQLTGTNAFTLKLISGGIAPTLSQSFTMSVGVNQFAYGSNFVTGAYQATFAISSFVSALRPTIDLVGSATFHTIWGSNDGTVPFMTGTLVVKAPDRAGSFSHDRQLIITMPNLRQTYKRASVPRIRVNVFDIAPENAVEFSKLPRERSSLMFETYWRLLDVYSGDVIIPFDTDNSSTKLSIDTNSMYFDFYPEDLHIGRVFGFEFLIRDGNEELIIDKNLPTFRIEQ